MQCKYWLISHETSHAIHTIPILFHPRTRHFPGPRPKWLVGNALDLYTEGMFVPALYLQWGRRYGPVWKWFLGLQPVVVVQDAELARLILVKHFAAFHDRHLGAAPVHPLRRLMMRSGILFSRSVVKTSPHGILLLE